MDAIEKRVIALLESKFEEDRKKGFGKLYEAKPYYEMMFLQAWSIIKDEEEAKDVVNNFLSKKVGKGYRLSDSPIKKSLKAFLRKSIKNESLNRLEQLGRAPKDEFPSNMDDGYHTPEFEVFDITDEQQKLLEECISQKNDPALQEFAALLFSGKKIKEIKEIMQLDYNQYRNLKGKFRRQGIQCAKKFNIKDNPWTLDQTT